MSLPRMYVKQDGAGGRTLTLDDCRCILCMIRDRIVRETLADCTDEQLAALQRHAEIKSMEADLEADRSDCGGQTVNGPPCGGCGACMRKTREAFATLEARAGEARAKYDQKASRKMYCTHCGAEDGVCCYSWCFSRRKVTP